jgi:RHS repeat-associated protein
MQEVTGQKQTNYFFGRFIPEVFWENGIQRSVIHSHPSRASEFLDQRGMPVCSSTIDDWGLPSRLSQHTTRFGSPGQYWDGDLQLFYNRFRYYSPAAGRFISPDPIGYLGGLNEYSSGPNPISWIDPLGLRCGLTHNKVVVNDDLKGQGGQPDPTRADWFAKQDAFNAGIEAGQQSGNPVVVPSAAQYALDRGVGNAEAAAARVAQGMGPGVQADHPVDLRCGGGQGQALYPLASGVNGSVGSQTGSWARQQPPGTPTPMIDLYDKSGNLVRAG